MTSVQFEPGVVYALFDRANDYVWIRPYVGSVLSFRHETLERHGPVALNHVGAMASDSASSAGEK